MKKQTPLSTPDELMAAFNSMPEKDQLEFGSQFRKWMKLHIYAVDHHEGMKFAEKRADPFESD